jgi:hypothetical protein
LLCDLSIASIITYFWRLQTHRQSWALFHRLERLVRLCKCVEPPTSVEKLRQCRQSEQGNFHLNSNHQQNV